MMLSFSLIPMLFFTIISKALPITDYPFDQVPFLLNTHLKLYSSFSSNQKSDSTVLNSKELVLHNIHSHNDYWRLQPLFSALELGITSVEADVWSFKDELGDSTIYVGHKLLLLNGLRTLQSLYIDPIYEILNSKNPVSNDTTKTYQNSSDSQIGIFESHPDQTLYLWIDFKTEGGVTYDAVYQALEPLRSRGWLTTFDQETQIMKQGLITVIGSGNVPLSRVLAETQRDLFFDAPLAHLNDTFTPNVSPFASASIKKLVGKVGSYWSTDALQEDQYDTLKSIIDDAHSKGLKTRIWDIPTGFYSKKLLNIWEQVLGMGSDYLNADELELAVKYA